MNIEMNFTEFMQVIDRETKEGQRIILDMSSGQVGIMDCTLVQLKDIVNCFTTRCDDYIQLAGDAGKNDLVDYFENAYNELEKVFFHLKAGGLISDKSRNELRSLIKETLKMGSMINYNQ